MVAKYCSKIVVGGVVMSKKRVKSCRTLITGSLSCGSHDFTGPVINSHINYCFSITVSNGSFRHGISRVLPLDVCVSFISCSCKGLS